ncbi:PQQ-dependent sugar dehydrogenase [Baekduia soli]|uniref:PQQ-dependent sugar dehydrogenase n=1 Tax=Baekduia soli TaxID=496014 RepID=A0A5B8UC59_9ACTN|nr:PQQ-dependent sugar dehydrogenase [Baekduia soli]QEC50232.1 PQQ-dependent sugar dehydrogenase [Baekduia soli]
MRPRSPRPSRCCCRPARASAPTGCWDRHGHGGGEFDAHHNAQRLDPATDDPAAGADALPGKLLRIDPAPGDGCGGACTIPAGNAGFAQREVWAHGLRNPWRSGFDDATGDLLLARAPVSARLADGTVRREDAVVVVR